MENNEGPQGDEQTFEFFRDMLVTTLWQLAAPDGRWSGSRLELCRAFLKMAQPNGEISDREFHNLFVVASAVLREKGLVVKHVENVEGLVTWIEIRPSATFPADTPKTDASIRACGDALVKVVRSLTQRPLPQWTVSQELVFHLVKQEVDQLNLFWNPGDFRGLMLNCGQRIADLNLDWRANLRDRHGSISFFPVPAKALVQNGPLPSHPTRPRRRPRRSNNGSMPSIIHPTTVRPTGWKRSKSSRPSPFPSAWAMR